MVELVVPKCPRCGADLQVTPGSGAAVCRYCEAQVLVVGTQQDGAAADQARLEIEKRQMALGMLAQELSEMEGAANRLLSEIKMLENPVAGNAAKGSVVFIILFFMMAMMGGMIGGLFYILDIYFVWGFTKSMCLMTTVAIICIGVGGGIAVWFWNTSSLERNRARNMQSPEYMMRVQQHQQLQAQLQAKRAELEATEQQLKALLLGNPR
jgi:DNA-directed RNA polymerase subunit RPC12/RpoP